MSEYLLVIGEILAGHSNPRPLAIISLTIWDSIIISQDFKNRAVAVAQAVKHETTFDGAQV